LLLRIFLSHDAVVAYLYRCLGNDDGAVSETWDAIVASAMQVVPPKDETTWHPSVLVSKLPEKPDEFIRDLARAAGEGPGGLLLLLVARARVLTHLAGTRHLVGEEVTTTWRTICKRMQHLSFLDAESLISRGSLAALVHCCLDAEKAADAQETPSETNENDAKPGKKLMIQAVEVQGHKDRDTEPKTKTNAKATKKPIEAADFVIAGFFRHNTSFRGFIADAMPILIITVYTTWFETTRQMFRLMQVGQYQVEVSPGVIKTQTRWLMHADWQIGEMPHLIVMAIALAGAAVWSFLSLVVMDILIRRHKHHQSFVFLRNYSYIIMGYDVDNLDWDLVHKKLDLFITLTVTYTSLVPDLKGKLMCYTVLAGYNLVAHAGTMPFDDRNNQLLDLLEYWGLAVRFATFALIELLMIFNPPMIVSTVIAVFVILMCIIYVIFTMIMFCTEFVVNLGGQAKSRRAKAEAQFRNLRSRVHMLGRSVIGLVLGIVVSIAGVKRYLEERTLGFQSKPLNSEVEVVHERQGCGIVGRGIAYFFRLGDGHQKEFIASVLGQFLTHIMTRMDYAEIRIGDGLLAQFILLARSLKTAAERGEIPKDADVRRRKTIAIEFIPEVIQKGCKRALTGEDMHDLMMILHRLRRDEIVEFLGEAEKAIDSATDKYKKGSMTPKKHKEKKLAQEAGASGREGGEDSALQGASPPQSPMPIDAQREPDLDLAKPENRSWKVKMYEVVDDLY